MSSCQNCNNPLSTNEVGISLRLLGRDGRRILCRQCLSRELKIAPELIDRKIEQFKRQGCPLLV